MSKYRLAILKNETNIDHLNWIDACEQYSEEVAYDVIDLVADNWLEAITNKTYDLILTRPPGRVAYFKQLYDERIYILNKVLDLPIYPTLNELFIYENKRFLSYFLQANSIPHPKTWVFYQKNEALNFLKNQKLPIVAKTNIGAGGSGVRILKTRTAAENYIAESFSDKGIIRSFSPNIKKGDYYQRLKKRLRNIGESIDYFKEKKKAATIEPQKWFVIFQEYIKSDYEWRCVVIDNSYFGHKKLRTIGEKMSGTSRVSWDLPDEKLLNLVKQIVDNNTFHSIAIDLFYNEERGYLVNEMQCFWGSKDSHQMMRNGKPGRYISSNASWIFEEGSFNLNNSYNLRLRHAIKLLNKQ